MAWLLLVADAATLGLVVAVAARRKLRRSNGNAARHHLEHQEDTHSLGDAGAENSWAVAAMMAHRRVATLGIDVLAAKRAAQHFASNLKKAHESLVIAGAGPSGSYFALCLLAGLRDAGCVLPHVLLYDPCPPFRRSCIYIPFDIAAGLPAHLRGALFPHAEAKGLLYHFVGSHADPRYYPVPDMEHRATIALADFEEKIAAHLRAEFPWNFKSVSIQREEAGEDKFRYAVGPEHDHQIVGFVCAAGGQGHHLRELPDLEPTEAEALQSVGRAPNPEPCCHGFIVQWNNTEFEPFYPRMASDTLVGSGFIYLAANNERLDCQLYCYAEGTDLASLYAAIKPEWAEVFAEKLRLSPSTPPAHLDTELMPGLPTPGGDEELLEWFRQFRTQVVASALRLGVFDSCRHLRNGENLSRAKIYYAGRGGFVYERVQALIHGVPTFFVGDAAGSTDYRFGLSGGRGLHGAKALADAIVSRRSGGASLADSVVAAMPSYQRWWVEQLRAEFCQGDLRQPCRPTVLARYLVGAREYSD